MAIVAYIFYALAAIDFITGNFMGMDLTGVFWSPIALGAIGALLMNFASE